MRQSSIPLGFVAAISAVSLAWAVQAQQTEEAPETKTAPELPAIEQPDAAPGDREQARTGHLDGLFSRLANPDTPDWERVQAQIWAAWNRSGSDSMDLLAVRADQAMEAKDYEAAVVFLNDLTRLAPEFAEGWNKRATLHFIEGRYGQSIDDIARTLAIEPRHFGALSGLGIILDRLGDKKGALEAYRKAVEIHPNLPGAQDGIKKLSKEVEGQRL